MNAVFGISLRDPGGDNGERAILEKTDGSFGDRTGHKTREKCPFLIVTSLVLMIPIHPLGFSFFSQKITRGTQNGVLSNGFSPTNFFPQPA